MHAIDVQVKPCTCEIGVQCEILLPDSKQNKADDEFDEDDDCESVADSMDSLELVWHFYDDHCIMIYNL